MCVGVSGLSVAVKEIGSAAELRQGERPFPHSHRSPINIRIIISCMAVGNWFCLGGGMVVVVVEGDWCSVVFPLLKTNIQRESEFWINRRDCSKRAAIDED